ncbi:MAG TPA: GGDEF domain-containing protein [Comamonadaceae bacterium]|nr:GGDEF domain-containing protein [Comamonadaceae bacterium]
MTARICARGAPTPRPSRRCSRATSKKQRQPASTAKLRSVRLFLFVSTSALLASVNLKDLQLSTAHALVAQSLGSEATLSGRAPREYLQALIDGLCDLSLKDPLTGLPNRRFIRAVLDSEIDRVARSGEAALLLMLDIDHFKQVNDRHGHGAGDLVLQSVAQTLQTCLRPMDTVARYGGEEFAIVLPACQFGFGRVVAERVRRAIEATPITISPNLAVHVTVSIGGAFALQWIRSTVPLWAERADAELYKAKAGGRNRISIEEQPDSTVTAEEKSMLFGPLYTPSGWGELPPPLDPPAYSAY